MMNQPADDRSSNDCSSSPIPLIFRISGGKEDQESEAAAAGNKSPI